MKITRAPLTITDYEFIENIDFFTSIEAYKKKQFHERIPYITG